ncbi:MAG: hypothetical protein CMJ64_20885 [Planctomycetaceae bacterium]|nr:hypothetical protein [Planctomycetaceae bacterium]
MREIRKEKKEFDFEVKLGGRSVVRTYTFDKVHAVTMNGKRFVLNKKTEVADVGGATRRTQAQVLELIDTVGRTPPDWFESTQLDYPKTLDLSRPLKPPQKGWKNQVNVGQYKWDIINPNPNRWKPGLRLFHHIMASHKKEPALLRRDTRAIAEMYFELFQDYPRAAFWLRQAKVRMPEPQAVHLAECYWQLGNKKMALETIKSQRLPMNAIKLLGDIGETDRAAKLADSFGRNNPKRAHGPYLLGGDACRLAGRYDEAIEFYQKVLDAEKDRNENYEKIYVGRARDSIDAINLFDKADVSKVADGVYKASSTGYTGALEVEVRVRGGKIATLRVSRHTEKQFYAALTDTPDQIIAKQSVKGIDATSRATITSQAIVNSTAKAFAKGSR